MQSRAKSRPSVRPELLKVCGIDPLRPTLHALANVPYDIWARLPEKMRAKIVQYCSFELAA